MTPLLFWGRKAGKTAAMKAALLAAQQREYETLLASTHATIAWQSKVAQAQADWRKYAAGLTNPAAIGTAVAEHNLAKYGYCPAHPFLNNPPPMTATYAIRYDTHAERDDLRRLLASLAIHFATDLPDLRAGSARGTLRYEATWGQHCAFITLRAQARIAAAAERAATATATLSTMIHPYRLTREFNNPTELEIFKQVLREHPLTDHATNGATVTFSGSAEQILNVDARYREILRANEENERVHNTPPPTSDQAAAAAVRQKNRCYESITEVQVKGPNSGERYTVRVWRSLFILATAENTSIQQWASQLNQAIDSMSPVHRKQTVSEAWIISRLEYFTSMGEHRIVAVEVKDSDGNGKLLYPDWS